MEQGNIINNEEENEIDINNINILEENQINMKDNFTESNDEIKSIKDLTLSDSDNKSVRLCPNDKSNEIELIVPYIEIKRLRKNFKTRKKRRSSAL